MKSESFLPRPRSLFCVFCRNTNLNVSVELGSIQTNVRVIAATNRDLEAAIAAGVHFVATCFIG